MRLDLGISYQWLAGALRRIPYCRIVIGYMIAQDAWGVSVSWSPNIRAHPGFRLYRHSIEWRGPCYADLADYGWAAWLPVRGFRLGDSSRLFHVRIMKRAYIIRWPRFWEPTQA